jgi:hypothetical protein
MQVAPLHVLGLLCWAVETDCAPSLHNALLRAASSRKSVTARLPLLGCFAVAVPPETHCKVALSMFGPAIPSETVSKEQLMQHSSVWHLARLQLQ